LAAIDPIVAHWKRHWPADRDERVRRERSNLRLFIKLVQSGRTRLHQARILVVNAGPKAVLEHLDAKTRIAIDPSNDCYIAEGLLRPQDGDGGTMYLTGDLRDGSLPAGYFDFIFLNFHLADAGEACEFLRAALRVAARWGRIAVNLTLSRPVDSRDEELLRSAVPGHGEPLKLETVNGFHRLRGLLKATGPEDQLKLSVLLFTYNHRAFIHQALDSVLTQETQFPFEIVVLDDASTDGTRDIVTQYAARHPGKFRLVLNETNVGLHNRTGMTRVWRELLRRGEGEYTALIEGDDYWSSPHKLQKQVDFLETHPDFILCGHDNDIRSEWQGTETRKRRRFPADTALSIPQLLEYSVLHMSSLVYRNGIVRDWPSEFLDLKGADWPLQILFAQFGGVWVFAEAMSVYRIHSGGFWSGRYCDRDNLGVTPEGWQLVLDFRKVLNRHLGYKYAKLMRTLIDSRGEQIAAQAAPRDASAK
jgi:glycosyltransferase involved in cell wall biosynthesis